LDALILRLLHDCAGQNHAQNGRMLYTIEPKRPIFASLPILGMLACVFPPAIVGYLIALALPAGIATPSLFVIAALLARLVAVHWADVRVFGLPVWFNYLIVAAIGLL
jgi:hypothetical protein